MRTLLCLGFLIVSIPRTFAESPNILDILPENAAGSITVRSLADLKKKGDTFLKDAEWNLPWRPSQIMEFGFTIVGNPKGVDHDGFVSAVFVNKGDSDAPHGIGIVLIFQVSDQDAIARDYELKPEDIKPGKILKIKSPSSWFSLSYLAVQDKKFYIGESKQALESVMKSKPLRGQLTAQQQKDFAQGDLFLHINPQGIYGAGWKEEVKDWSKELEEKKDPFVDAEFMKLMIESLPTLKFGLAQIRVEDGLNLRVTASFEDNDKAKKLLKALGSASPASNLNGLPEGDVLFAQSAKGDGTQTASLIRTLLHFAFNYNDATHDLISSTDRPMYLGVFAEIWKHLRGARMALYQNPDPNKGLFSMCAIADTEDAEAFMKELRKMARIAEGDLKFDNQEGDDAKLLKGWLRDLSHDRFVVRERATNSLILLGIPALKPLDELIASKDADADLIERARKIRNLIAQSAEDRRKELREKTPLPARPTFAFAPKSETRDGFEIDTVLIRLSQEDQALKGKIEKLFGPKWNRIQLARHDNQLVVNFGSDQDLLIRTLQNLKKKDLGLGKRIPTKETIPYLTSSHQFETHFSLARAHALWNAVDIRKPEVLKDVGISTITGTLREDGLQIDVWIPVKEWKVIVKEFGF